MSVDELRAGLARAAATVVPPEDPYGRLLRHARRRRLVRRTGIGAALAGALAAALAVPATGIGFGGGGGDGPVVSEWVWRLIDAPTRGNLAGDTRLVQELTRVFGDARAANGVGKELSEVKVLFVDETAGIRQVVVVYHSDTEVVLSSRQARAGAAPAELLRGNGSTTTHIRPFNRVNGVGPAEEQVMVGLVPGGCTVSWAPTGQPAADGSIRRTWRPSPTQGYLLLAEPQINGWYRVECDGTVREEGPLDNTVQIDGSPPPPTTPPTGGGIPATEAAAANTYRIFARASGLGGAPVRRWSGRLPGGDGLTAAVVTGGPAGAPALLQIGPNGDTMLALAPPQDAVPDDSETLAAERAGWSLASTAAGGPADLTVVRIPVRAGGHAELGDQVLVVPPERTATVEAYRPDGSLVGRPVTDGATVLTLPVGERAMIRALAADGTVLASTGLREPEHGPRLFGEELISAW
ncbi:hypothetical protein [Micromonospora mirobrigensis]|uniref:Uncharacterized protein n=1 Tax=Micromonospora mirobrigensis TaxID=262898 RepID=A0A1C5ALU5_9ACTN|nr:hypothetical protein [Micromonospora mirobrigensis]SCF46179.1 hypothetical protein GA0070564_11318 [Micromonospora mirobrigensis]